MLLKLLKMNMSFKLSTRVGVAATLFGLLCGFSASQNLPKTLQLLNVDSTQSSISVDALFTGALPQTGIPALGFSGDWTQTVEASPTPSFISAKQAAKWLDPEEPVIAVTIGDESRAYPVQILIWHEIVNDTVGGTPIVITYCPLCNSAIAFDRRLPLDQVATESLAAFNLDAEIVHLDEQFQTEYSRQNPASAPVATGLEVTFGVSGMLYNSNVLMFDSHSSTLWAQLIGEAVMGSLNSTKLLRYPAQLVSFSAYREAFPSGLVLSRDTGFGRGYGSSLYIGYDSEDSSPFHFRGTIDDRLAAKERVIAIERDGSSIVYSFNTLRAERVVNSRVAAAPLVLFWEKGTRSALDQAVIRDGRDVGSVGVFSRNLDGRTLDFRWNGETFTDIQTSSSWSMLGQATSGPLTGAQLEPIIHYNTMWFAWIAFHPLSEVYNQVVSQLR
jgi:hypothetical protein